MIFKDIVLNQSLTIPQAFDSFLLNNTCSYFDRTICTNTTCGNNSYCVIYDWRGSICYVPQQKVYYRFNDYTHNVLYWIYFKYLGYSDFVLYFIIYIVFTFLDVLPEFVSLFKSKEKGWTLGQIISHFFSLKTQTICWIWLSLSLMVLMLVIDTLDVLRLKLCLIGIVFSIGMFYVSYFNLIIKWVHILNQSLDSSKENLPVSFCIIMICFYIGFSLVGVIGLIILIGHVFIAHSEHSPFIYCAGAYVATLFLITVVLAIVLSIISLRMIYILSSNQKEFSQNLFKLNFSKTVFG